MKLRITALVVVLAAVAFTAGQGSAERPAAPTHQAGTIAFLRLDKSPGFGASLFVVRPDGSGLRQLTPGRNSNRRERGALLDSMPSVTSGFSHPTFAAAKLLLDQVRGRDTYSALHATEE